MGRQPAVCLGSFPFWSIGIIVASLHVNGSVSSCGWRSPGVDRLLCCLGGWAFHLWLHLGLEISLPLAVWVQRVASFPFAPIRASRWCCLWLGCCLLLHNCQQIYLQLVCLIGAVHLLPVVLLWLSRYLHRLIALSVSTIWYHLSTGWVMLFCFSSFSSWLVACTWEIWPVYVVGDCECLVMGWFQLSFRLQIIPHSVFPALYSSMACSFVWLCWVWTYVQLSVFHNFVYIYALDSDVFSDLVGQLDV